MRSSSPGRSGLHVTVHAGEWGGAAQVLRSLSVDPERIAHGPHAIEDPACVAALIERGIASTCARRPTPRRTS